MNLRTLSSMVTIHRRHHSGESTALTRCDPPLTRHFNITTQDSFFPRAIEGETVPGLLIRYSEHRRAVDGSVVYEMMEGHLAPKAKPSSAVVVQTAGSEL